MSDASEGARAAQESGATGELARRVRAGDRAAFQQLYERVLPALYAWAQVRARASNAHVDAQDLVQEVWLRALRGLEAYDPARSFRAWVLGIGKNVLLQRYRGAAQQRLSPTDEEILRNCPDSVTSVGMRVAKEDAVQRFLEYVAGLPDEDRLLVLYCGLEEYTSAQAAARLAISPEAANKRWQALRARLREIGALRALALDELD